MKTKYLLILMSIGIFMVGCLPDDDTKKCNGDYVWNPKSEGCDLKNESIDGGSPIGNDGGFGDGSAPVSGEGGFSEAPTGMGENCSSFDDCAEYEADQCTATPYTPKGFCTVRNCSNAPDNCPAGFICCVFKDPAIVETIYNYTTDMPSSICLTQETYNLASIGGICVQ